MISLLLRMILGVALFFCSALSGMAQEAVAEKSRADIVAAAELGSEAEKQAAFSFEDAGLLPSLQGEERAESSVESESEVKRSQKRTSFKRFFIPKCRFDNSTSRKFQSKGVARHFRTQDARQERTAAVRFLQLASLAC